MKRHVTLKITTALALSDKELEAMFPLSADELRAEFKEDQANGHVFIGSEGCDGFDPVTGCPGHQD